MSGNESSDRDLECPLCLEELDVTDRNFQPCKCGYQVCLWCWHNINEKLNGKCPACRADYDPEGFQFTAPDAEALQRSLSERKSKKSSKAGGKDRKQAQPHVHRNDPNFERTYQNVRVLQRNLLYVVGIPGSLAREEILKKKDYFGRFGRIVKVAVNRKQVPSGAGFSYSVYVTYKRARDAAEAIKVIHGSTMDGRSVRATYGTTKYCSNFLRNLPCGNPNCLYLHDLAKTEDCYTKEDLSAPDRLPSLPAGLVPQSLSPQSSPQSSPLLRPDQQVLLPFSSAFRFGGTPHLLPHPQHPQHASSQHAPAQHAQMPMMKLQHRHMSPTDSPTTGPAVSSNQSMTRLSLSQDQSHPTKPDAISEKNRSADASTWETDVQKRVPAVQRKVSRSQSPSARASLSTPSSHNSNSSHSHTKSQPSSHIAVTTPSVGLSRSQSVADTARRRRPPPGFSGAPKRAPPGLTKILPGGMVKPPPGFPALLAKRPPPMTSSASLPAPTSSRSRGGPPPGFVGGTTPNGLYDATSETSGRTKSRKSQKAQKSAPQQSQKGRSRQASQPSSRSSSRTTSHKSSQNVTPSTRPSPSPSPSPPPQDSATKTKAQSKGKMKGNPKPGLKTDPAQVSVLRSSVADSPQSLTQALPQTVGPLTMGGAGASNKNTNLNPSIGGVVDDTDTLLNSRWDFHKFYADLQHMHGGGPMPQLGDIPATAGKHSSKEGASSLSLLSSASIRRRGGKGAKSRYSFADRDETEDMTGVVDDVEWQASFRALLPNVNVSFGHKTPLAQSLTQSTPQTPASGPVQWSNDVRNKPRAPPPGYGKAPGTMPLQTHQQDPPGQLGDPAQFRQYQQPPIV